MIDEQLRREAEAAEAEMRQLDAEFEHTEGEAGWRSQPEPPQRAKLDAIVDRVDAAIKQDRRARGSTRDAARPARRCLVAGEEDHARDRRGEGRPTMRQEKLAEARKHAKAALELTGEAIRP
jgi:hypothetical protein